MRLFCSISLAISIIIFFGAKTESFAQYGMEQATYTIAGMEVQGNKYSDAETIVNLTGLRIGDKITLPSDNKLNTAIRNLWKRKQFSSVEIMVDRLTELGVFLVIKVEEFPRLNSVNVESNEELTKREIIDDIGKVKGDIITGYDLYMIEKNIKRLYEEEGLMFAKVDAELDKADTARYADMNIEIDEGVEFYVRSITFNGNEVFDDDDLASAFDDTHTKSWYEFWSSSKFDKNEYETDLGLLKQFFKREGYIDARILSDSLIYNEDEETVDIVLNVDEGNKYYLRNVSFEGNTVYEDDLLLKRLDFKVGDEYNAEQFEANLRANEDQTDVSSLYMDNGYLMFRIEKEEKRVASDSVDVKISIFENSRVTIRRVNIVGNTKTKDKVIRRELYTRPGDYFNRSAIIRSVKALGVLQYFNPEALRPDVKPVDNTRVDLEYTVEEQSTDTFNASIGFAGTFGLTGAIGMTFNNFSLAEPLQGGAGQVLNFTWEFGQASRYQTLSLGFTEPWLFDEPTTVGFNIFNTNVDYFYKLKRTGIQFNVGRRFRWPDDYWRGDWSIRLQENNVGENISSYYRPGLNTEITLVQSFSRISLNNRFFATDGSQFSYTTSVALGAAGLGTTDYIKNEITFDTYNPLYKIEDYDRVVLYLGTKMGYLTGFESDTAMSPLELYYMGGNGLSGFGVTPLRGYDDRAVGVQDGGRIMLRTTAELRFALAVNPMPIYFYGFAEAGNVWTNLRNTDPFDLKRSAGVGVQLMINPIGIIGFSYGYGFDKDNTGVKSGWKFLFHLGNYM